MLYVRMLFLCLNLDAWSSPTLTSFVDSQRFMSLHHALVESLDCVVYILSHHVLSCFISCSYLISFIYPVFSSVSQSIHSFTGYEPGSRSRPKNNKTYFSLFFVLFINSLSIYPPHSSFSQMEEHTSPAVYRSKFAGDIPLLSHTNYHQWNRDITIHLESIDVFRLLVGSNNL